MRALVAIERNAGETLPLNLVERRTRPTRREMNNIRQSAKLQAKY